LDQVAATWLDSGAAAFADTHLHSCRRRIIGLNRKTTFASDSLAGPETLPNSLAKLNYIAIIVVYNCIEHHLKVSFIEICADGTRIL
jgi:hypothetical protein